MPAALRRGLPTRRAVLGGILLTVAAAGVLVSHRAAATPPRDRFVVATTELAAGQRVTAGDLGTVAVDLPRGVVAVPADQAEGLIGRVARTSVEELALLRPGDLYEVGRFDATAAVEVAVDLTPARALLGSVRVGDLVDVLSTDPDASGTRQIATGARITAVTDPEEGGIGADGSVRVRLGLADHETATAVVDAAIRSELSLILPAPTRSDAG